MATTIIQELSEKEVKKILGLLELEVKNFKKEFVTDICTNLEQDKKGNWRLVPMKIYRHADGSFELWRNL